MFYGQHNDNSTSSTQCQQQHVIDELNIDMEIDGNGVLLKWNHYQCYSLLIVRIRGNYHNYITILSSSVAMLIWAKSLTAIYQYKETIPPPLVLLEVKVCNLLIDFSPFSYND